MYYKVYMIFMMLSIAESYVVSTKAFIHELNTFAQNLILKNFDRSRFVGILHDNKGIYEMNLPQFLQAHYIPVLVHDLVTRDTLYNSSAEWSPRHIMRPTDNNIIITEDLKDFQSMLQVANSIPIFSPRSNLLLILTQRFIGTTEWIREAFLQLWKIYSINVGLVFYTDSVNLFTYLPWTVPHDIQNLTDQGISENIFYDKLKDLHQYPIKVLQHTSGLHMIPVKKENSTIYLGIDGMTMNTFLVRHNASSYMINPEPMMGSPCIFIHYNQTKDGWFGADIHNESIDLCPFSLKLPKTRKRPSELNIIRYNVDVSFNSNALRFDIDYRVDTTYPRRKDDTCIIVPAGGRISQAINLLVPLSGYMWIAISLIFIIYSFVYFEIQTWKKSNKSFFQSCFILYSIQMNGAGPDENKMRESEKGCLLCWVLYSFLISAAYQSVLISFITVPLYEPSMNRLAELKEKDLSIIVQAEIAADMHNAIDKETSEIVLEKLIVQKQSNQAKYDMKNGYLEQKSFAQYLVQRKDYTDENGKPLFHVMNECPMPLLVTYQIPYGSPLLEIIDNLTSKTTESGLDIIWQAEAMRYLDHQMPRSKVVDHREVIITTSHLQGAFYILLVGYVLGTVAFLFEIRWWYTDDST